MPKARSLDKSGREGSVTLEVAEWRAYKEM